jgi:hypothetical protein
MQSNGTPVYTRQHKRGLTLAQQNAVDLLVGGKNDTETAELLSLSRSSVTKWRLYDPVFQAALNQRRAEVWGTGLDRLRALIPKALNALAEELERADNPNRWKVASAILRLARLPSGDLGIGCTDPDEIVRQVVLEKRKRVPGVLDRLEEDGKDLPSFGRHMEETWRELAEKAADADSTAEAQTCQSHQGGGA